MGEAGCRAGAPCPVRGAPAGPVPGCGGAEAAPACLVGPRIPLTPTPSPSPVH